jgi:hypothetical protein
MKLPISGKVGGPQASHFLGGRYLDEFRRFHLFTMRTLQHHQTQRQDGPPSSPLHCKKRFFLQCATTSIAVTSF